MFTPKFVAVVALAFTLAALGAGWKWSHMRAGHAVHVAGWTWETRPGHQH
jgi:hypothetical protein